MTTTPTATPTIAADSHSAAPLVGGQSAKITTINPDDSNLLDEGLLGRQNDKTNLLGLSKSQLEQFFVALGEKPFRATQVMKWIYQFGVTDFF